MAKRITLPQLVEKIQSRKLTPQEARDYFLAEPNPRQPFDFDTYVNPEYVDVKNFESLARDADLLVTNISTAPPGRKKVISRRKGTTHRVVAEGDSWFRLPKFWPFPKTCIDYLQAWGYPIVNLARWGDTLDEMLQVGEFWPYLGGSYDVLLFSGGGNDVLGGGHLADYLNLFDSGHTSPSDAPYYVKDKFFKNLNRIVSNIENGLIIPVAGLKSNKKILMHGYDYVIPRPQGPWIGNAMMEKNLDPTFNAGLCRAIIKLMINAYNVKLKALAAKYSDVFVHVDLRGTVGANQWFDELHGKDVAAEKIARKFAANIDTVKITAARRAISSLYLPVSSAA
jgi:hypothetical protein